MGRDNTANQYQLPPGYTFEPTDEELVVHYLTKHIADPTFPFPAFIRQKIMLFLDLYQHHPHHLSGIYNYDPNDQRHMYFFTKTSKNTSDGHWLSIKINKAIVSKGVMVGYKNKFIYELENTDSLDDVERSQDSNTSNWVMYEIHAGAPATNTDSSDDMDDEWVVCKILKKDGPIDTEETEQMEEANMNFGTWQELDDHQELNTSFAAL